MQLYLPVSLHPSPIFHTWTDLSNEPVAIRPRAGDTATAVTYLQKSERAGKWRVCWISWRWHRKRPFSEIRPPLQQKKRRDGLKTSLNPFKHFKALWWFLPVVPHQWLCREQKYTVASLHPAFLGETNQAKVAHFDLKHQGFLFWC